ncbi:hypothetical protein FUA23_11770 [Neolewinella aurantiaca]|uniref:Uncharacterized protein n=1 Tax=Neolewinella aurantiaca TaxID=2602767 RepID=A0A5C7FFT9_9BACT|nr:hypothetical protein [Neolewinella aurantiaca]TXF89182.1 hypothetical protein FUA23_11770 [Neolewinella aurantiaca]
MKKTPQKEYLGDQQHKYRAGKGGGGANKSQLVFSYLQIFTINKDRIYPHSCVSIRPLPVTLNSIIPKQKRRFFPKEEAAFFMSGNHPIKQLLNS